MNNKQNILREHFLQNMCDGDTYEDARACIISAHHVIEYIEELMNDYISKEEVRSILTGIHDDLRNMYGDKQTCCHATDCKFEIENLAGQSKGLNCAMNIINKTKDKLVKD